MTWQNRTEGGRKRAILIDEATKDWRIVSGKLQFDSTSVSQVYHAITTKVGSIVTDPDYGSELYNEWLITTTMPREMEASILSALEPLENANVVKANSASVDVTILGPNQVALVINWTDGGGQKQDLTIPIQPGFSI